MHGEAIEIFYPGTASPSCVTPMHIGKFYSCIQELVVIHKLYVSESCVLLYLAHNNLLVS